MNSLNILVPVDFSDCSKKALLVAIQLAKTFGSGLVIMNACENPQGFGDISEATMAEEFIKSLEAKSRKSYRELEASVPQLKEVEHEFVIKHSFVRDAVEDMLLADEFGLVVIGTTGASGLRKVILGSNAYDIIKHVDCPVLTIPEKSHVHTAMKHIVLAGDYDRTYGRSTFHFLIELVKACNAEVQILHVSDTTILDTAKIIQGSKLQHYFERIKHRFHFVVDVNIDVAIQEFLEKQKADLLVLVYKKHNLIDRFFKGNLTKRMAFHSKTPLLILKAKKS